jgi:hypothetical protein
MPGSSVFIENSVTDKVCLSDEGRFAWQGHVIHRLKQGRQPNDLPVEVNETGFPDPVTAQKLPDNEFAVRADEDLTGRAFMEPGHSPDDGMVFSHIIRADTEEKTILVQDFTHESDDERACRGARISPGGSVSIELVRMVRGVASHCHIPAPDLAFSLIYKVSAD